jgi:hypothetical protein
MNDDRFDPEKLRIPPAMIEANWRAQREAQKPARSREGRRFIQMPWDWHIDLVDAPGHTLWLAEHLAYLDWKAHGQPFKLANMALAEMGVTRYVKWRALRELERRGLIRVQSCPGGSPTITILRPAR